MKTKIKHFLLLFLVVFTTSIFAQNNSVGIGTTTPDNSAILDLVSTNQGLLIPRNNTSGITTITAPSDGLILYNTDDKCYWFWNNSAWKRLCDTDSLLTMINNLGDTIGFIYDSLAVHNNNISNLTTIVNNHSDSLDWIYDSLAVHNTNIFNNTSNINNLYDSVDVINNSITNLTTIINNHSDSLDWIYDSLAVHNTNITNNTTNIATNTTNIQNLSDSLGWVYDSLAVHNTNITTNTTNISNLYDSVDVINTHLGVVDSTLLNKWDIYGNVGTNPTTNFLGTIDNQHLVFRTNNTEKVRITTTGRLGIGTNNPTQLLDINSNALRLRTGATNNFVLTTDATGVGTWQDPSLNPILTTYITTTTAPLGNDWKLLGNAGTNASTNFLGTTDNVDLVFRTNNVERGRVTSSGSFFITGNGGSVPLSGAGVRFMWASNKQAIRAGQVTGTEWDNANIGTRSFSQGYNTIASGQSSFSFGTTTTSSANYSFSYGLNTSASGIHSFAFGNGTIATSPYSVAFGFNCSSIGWYNFAGGNGSSAAGANSLAYGFQCSSSGGIAMGVGATTGGTGAVALGSDVTASLNGDVAIGSFAVASGGNSTAFHVGSNATHNSSFVIGQTNSLAIWGFTTEFIGGYTLYTNGTSTTGATLAAGSGTWASVSDRNLKTNITKLDYNEVLNKYKNFDITKWSYIAQTVNGQDKVYTAIVDGKLVEKPLPQSQLYSKDINHIGIMAQDFYKEFGLGTSEKLITALDVAGVNMAAIKALLERIERLEENNKLLLERINSEKH
ncbi:MAG: tail fiber domain-containing protein [Flavobacteriales bacterium]|nr:tail fiber domain-containing protein [Flavobacteriales bacterium]